MKKIEQFTGVATKTSGTGKIKYCLWVDSGGNLFVQIIDNEGAGSYSKLLFSVDDYEQCRNKSEPIINMRGYDVESKSYKNSDDNNNGSFIKSILNDLLPERKS